MTNVICGLTAKKPGSSPCPTLILLLTYLHVSNLAMTVTLQAFSGGGEESIAGAHAEVAAN